MGNETRCPECHHPIRFSDNEAGICEKIIGPSDRASLCGCLCVFPNEDSQVDQWRPIETAPKMRKLLVGYFNPLGKWRTVLAQYWIEGELESETDESGFAPEGWYEATEAYEYLAPLDQEPTRWMPLPNPPKQLTPPQ